MVNAERMRSAVLSSKRNMWLAIAILTVIALIVIGGVSTYAPRDPSDKGNVIVYGSRQCPWTVKQEDYLKNKGIPYEFVDCSGGNCPSFVDGFPTLSVNGQIMNGYKEI